MRLHNESQKKVYLKKVLFTLIQNRKIIESLKFHELHLKNVSSKGMHDILKLFLYHLTQFGY